MTRSKKSKIREQPSDAPPFAEAPAWASIGAGWRPLFASYRELGFSFEWHEFKTDQGFDWAPSFHPDSIELCLNLEGRAELSDGTTVVQILPETFALYYQGNPPLVATRQEGSMHRFITVEFSTAFLREYFQSHVANICPLVRSVIQGEAIRSSVAAPERLTVSIQQMVDGLRHCPVFTPAREMWFLAKILELAAHLFFQPASGELLCSRTQRLARERVEKAKLILKERMQTPPSLEELARLVSCSPFYLSRQFAQSGGLTMQQYLRRVRLEKAAQLLSQGRCNVTEAALEVGYNSLSHFSTAFHEAFGCCPGLYPLKTETQQGF